MRKPNSPQSIDFFVLITKHIVCGLTQLFCRLAAFQVGSRSTLQTTILKHVNREPVIQLDEYIHALHL